MIEGKIEPSSAVVGDTILVSLKLTNTGSDQLKEINVQVGSAALKQTLAKTWPKVIYPNASVEGLYTLEAASSGKHSVYVTATYTEVTMGSTATSRQQTLAQTIGEIMIEPSPSEPLSPLWQGILTTILGAIIGFVFPQIQQSISAKRASESESLATLQKVKSILTYELKLNINRLEGKQIAQVDTLAGLSREGLLFTLDQPLIERILAAYSDLEKYNNEVRRGTQPDTTGLVNNLSAILTTVDRIKVK